MDTLFYIVSIFFFVIMLLANFNIKKSKESWKNAAMLVYVGIFKILCFFMLIYSILKLFRIL